MSIVREVIDKTIAGFLAVLFGVHIFSFWRSQIRKSGDRKIRRIGTKAGWRGPIEPQ